MTVVDDEATHREYARMCATCRYARGEHYPEHTFERSGGIARNASQRERKLHLLNMLRSRGLGLRADSRLCMSYIQSGIGDPRTIVVTMEEMDWFFACTNYSSARVFYEDYSDYGDEYDSSGGYNRSRRRKYVDSEHGKEVALNKWVSKRVSRGIWTSPANDTDTDMMPPESLWDTVDNLILEKGEIPSLLGDTSTQKSSMFSNLEPSMLHSMLTFAFHGTADVVDTSAASLSGPDGDLYHTLMRRLSADPIAFGHRFIQTLNEARIAAKMSSFAP
ncbi:hypothetical protein HDU93_000440 [Gonapodya sp. JEL0774]|nr:hypothetical protein HDU93_000440 [Gonapodya sp. JEL0774]